MVSEKCMLAKCADLDWISKKVELGHFKEPSVKFISIHSKLETLGNAV